MKEAIGIIETIGLVAAISALDVALKAADVTLIGYENSKGGGLITVKISGKVGAVKAALDATISDSQNHIKISGKLVIPRPSEEIKRLIYNRETKGYIEKIEKGKILEEKEIVKLKNNLDEIVTIENKNENLEKIVVENKINVEIKKNKKSVKTNKNH